MRYVSTRGTAPELGFADVLLAGLAADGGLYVPAEWPRLDLDRARAAATESYQTVATEVMAPFVEPDLSRAELADLVDRAYATFDADDVVPVVELEPDLWVVELFHGPTLAFKDVALQLVGQLFEHELDRRHQRVTIVGATSGDTGSAAIEACRGRSALDIVILHPAGRVSAVQRRQMTTVTDANVVNLAIEGTFDDCQDLVKALFADAELRRRANLSAVNSINWARVMAQIVYYVWAWARITDGSGPISFVVPTGNFGNVFAGEVARRMGLPVETLVVASNRNDILTQFFDEGVMTIGEVHPTVAPSMDIQVSSNLERLIFELYDRNGAAVAELLAGFRRDGTVRFDAQRHQRLSEGWRGVRYDDAETLSTIDEVYRSTAMLLDPHSAIGVRAAQQLRATRPSCSPTVALATAHPAKFPDAVAQATGIRPELPRHLADLGDRPERYETLPADLAVVRDRIAAVADSSA